MDRPEALKLAVEHVNSMARPGPLGAGASIADRAAVVERFARFLMEDDAQAGYPAVGGIYPNPPAQDDTAHAETGHSFFTGTQFRDKDGDVWTVQVDGMLTSPVLHSPRTLASLRAAYGPLERLEDDTAGDTPRPGRRYRDRDGDVWTVRENDLLSVCDDQPGHHTLASLRQTWGPLTRLED